MKTNRLSSFQNLFNCFSFLFSIDPCEYTSKRKVLRLPHIPALILIDFLDDLSNIFAKEANILRISSPLIIVGDLHGQILDLFRILKENGTPSPPENDIKYLFLGDFVDRGQFSFETVVLILTMKFLWPNNVFIVRGNHEFEEIYNCGGFQQEIDDLYKDQQQNNSKVSSFFQICFSNMPLSAIIDEYAICLHGGIGPSVRTLESIDSVERPVFTFASKVVADLLWSDPTEYILNFQPSARGSGSLFGLNTLNDFLLTSKLEIMIRGHQCVENGIASLWDDKCYTVFSASNYCNVSNNKAGILKVYPEKRIESLSFEPISTLLRSDARFVDSNSQSWLDFPSPESKMSSLFPKPRDNFVKRPFIPSLQYSNKKHSFQNIPRIDYLLGTVNNRSSNNININININKGESPATMKPKRIYSNKSHEVISTKEKIQRHKSVY